MKAAWEPAGNLLPSVFFFPPTTQAYQSWQSQIHRLCPRSSHSTCQQARLSSCEYLVGMDLWSFYSILLLRRGQLPVLNQVSCSFVQQILEPLPRMEFLSTPLGICPRATHLPHEETFPQDSTWTSQATICDLFFVLHHLPPPRKVWLCHFTTAFQGVGCYYYIVFLPHDHARTLLLALKMGHSSQRRSPTSCWMLASTWHPWAGVTSICKQAT